MSNKSRVNLAWLQVYVTLRLWLCMYGAAFPVRGMGSLAWHCKEKGELHENTTAATSGLTRAHHTT